jgi:hypothetical protein
MKGKTMNTPQAHENADGGECPHCGADVSTGGYSWSCGSDVTDCCSSECARREAREMASDEDFAAGEDHWS